MEKRYYGWQKSQKELPNKHKFGAIKLPDIIDLSQYKPVVVNQLEVGRCTGCGIGGAMSGKMSQLGRNLGNQFYWSPDDLYNGARVLEGSLNTDVGAEPVDVYKWVQEHGAIPYADMPIIPALSVTNPLLLESKAIMLPAFTPVQIDTRLDTVVANILDAMAAGNFVTQGAAFFAAWEDYKTGVLPLQRPTDPIGGFHETFYYKANTLTQIFYLQNSWGPLWGEQGLYQMPFDQVPILAKMGMDLHYATFNAPSSPTPAERPLQKYWQAPLAPIAEIAPLISVGPVVPVKPVPRVGPVAPVASAARVKPISKNPVAPVAPVKPVVPVNPVGPISPVKSVVPIPPVEPIN
jgi:hypothetical protein